MCPLPIRQTTTKYAPSVPVRLSRTSHADRERVIDTLKAAYVYGLVTKNELDERVSQTFAARTHAQLAVITADVPSGLAPLRPAAGHNRRSPASLPASAVVQLNVLIVVVSEAACQR